VTAEQRAADQPDRRLVGPLREFLQTEAAGGVVLLAAAVAALVWANSPWQDGYYEVWEGELLEWINEGLMTIFFFVVGLEIRREIVEGELRGVRRAVLPAVGALGGMVVPALVYLAFNAGGNGAEGWGIPTATDIAMAVGVLSLLGRRVASSLTLFLLALAIVDDIGAIAVIAIFYTDDLEPAWLVLAVVLTSALAALRALDVRSLLLPLAMGVGLWFALHEAGIHPTIAGVILALLAPPSRLEHVLHPWTSFLIVPLFALANTGVTISRDALTDAATSPITAGVLFGLVAGKLVGITAFTWFATRFRIGTLPDGATWRGIVGVAAVAGIGFTVSLFITDLAFDDASRQDAAKIGILTAAVLAGAVGALVLGAERPRSEIVRAQKPG
jgi:Na+:H+ antiporter, NhaA family